MTNRKKALLVLVTYVLIFYIINDFILIPISLKIINYFNLSSNARNIYSCIYNCLIYFIGFVAIFLLSYKEISIKCISFQEEKKSKFIENIIIGFFIYYIANMIGTIISYALVKDTVSNNQESIEIMVKNKGIQTIFNFLAICILGPIVEELVFRESLYNFTNNNILFLIISSLAFTLIHITSSSGNLRYMIGISIPYFCCGIALGIMYIKSKHNVFVTIAIHSIINLIA
ncbi:MAG: lysostaphin resistance A-like protein, partial [Anaeroplasmataceae bacterium]